MVFFVQYAIKFMMLIKNVKQKILRWFKVNFYTKEKFEEIDKVLTFFAFIMIFVNIIILFATVFIYSDFFFLIEYQFKATVLLFIVWVLGAVNLLIFDSSGGFDGKY